MKKKLVALLAIVLAIFTCCFTLVACGEDEEKQGQQQEQEKEQDKDQDICASPAQFIQKWLDSKNKTFYIKDGTAKGVVYGNLFMMTDCEKTFSIYEYVDGKINHYTTTSTGWEAYIYTVEDIEKDLDIKFEGINSIMRYFDYGKIDDILPITEDVFSANFEQKDGWYVGKNNFNNQKYKITANELTLKYIDDSLLTTKFDGKYVIGADPIVIPNEAKEALKKAQANK